MSDRDRLADEGTEEDLTDWSDLAMSRRPSPGWSPADIGDLSDSRYVVTGVTSGIGESVARELARHGAEVVLAARSLDKLATTEARLRRELPGARLHQVLIDLSELDSVRRAAAQISELGPLRALVHNAGVMATPYYRTSDGFDLQLATNHFGPFALTGLLLPSLVAAGDARVVSTASNMHLLARRPPLGDPRVHGGRYQRWNAYAGTKLAALMFTLELDERMRQAELPVRGVAAHPGMAATGLMRTGQIHGRERLSPTGALLQLGFSTFGQPPDAGALPTLMATTSELPGGSYVGPSGPGQLRGRPRLVRMRRRARDPDARRRLWQLSEDATGVRYP